MTYKIEIINGLMLLNIDGLTALVDTGSPVTYSRVAEFNFGGSNQRISGYRADGDFSIISLDRIAQMVGGRRIELFIGGDILWKFNVTFDLRAMELRLNQPLLPEQSFELPFRKLMGVPMITLPVAGRSFNLLLDTGAHQSYLSKRPNTPVVGKISDYNPIFGEFSAELHEVPVRVGSQEQLVKWGFMDQEMVNMALSKGGIDGIFGYDLFANRVVTFDSKTAKIWIG